MARSEGAGGANRTVSEVRKIIKITERPTGARTFSNNRATNGSEDSGPEGRKNFYT